MGKERLRTYSSATEQVTGGGAVNR